MYIITYKRFTTISIIKRSALKCLISKNNVFNVLSCDSLQLPISKVEAGNIKVHTLFIQIY